MQRATLAEIRDRTCKTRDAWWTVLLVDPLALRLVRLAAPYRWITPNRLTGLATVLGLAAAGCFAGQSRGWLIAGALLFHLAFVIDCMDGKIARLNGTGSLFGAWFDFMFDRLRVIFCAVALMGGQYARTGNPMFLWLAVAVISLDVLRYLNSSQMSKTRRAMSLELRREGDAAVIPSLPEGGMPAAMRPAAVSSGAVSSGGVLSGAVRSDALPPTAALPTVVLPAAMPDAIHAIRARGRAFLHRRRIRTHLVSGIEFEMAVFIIGPLTGWLAGTAVVAGGLLVAFELRLVYCLWRATQRHAVHLARTA